MIEAVVQMFVDGLVHPVSGLFVSVVIEVAVVFHEVYIFKYHIPDGFHSDVVESRICHDSRQPSRFRCREQVQSVFELCGSQFRFLYVASVRFVYD